MPRLSIALGLKVLIVAGAVFAAYQSAMFSSFQWLKTADAAAAFARQPDDGVALAQHLAAKLSANPGYRPSEREAELARRALIRNPVSSQALWILGLKAHLAGDKPRADAAMALAERLTRRDSLVQLWLIERSVEKDDIEGAVRHYNAALCVEPKLQATLFPILAKAIAFPEIRTALKPYLVNRALWLPKFVEHSASHASLDDHLAFVATSYPTLKTGAFAEANRLTVMRISREKGGIQAIDFAAKVLSDFDPKAFGAAGFSQATTDVRLGGLAWQLAQADGIDATLGNEGVLAVTLQPGALGIVAARDFPVSPLSTYNLSMTTRDTGTAPGEELRWVAVCTSQQASKEIARFKLRWPDGTARRGTSFVTPAGCSLLNLRLEADGGDTQLPQGLEVSQLRLARQ